MLRVWADRRPVGVIERSRGRPTASAFGDFGTLFSYDRGLSEECAVSLTMPVRSASWGVPRGLLPVFDMNLPEGALREHLTRAFAKAAGTFDDLDLLGVVGRSQIGRLRFTGLDETLDEDVPFASVDEILSARRDGDLYGYLVERFAVHSGISGVQPKVMLRDGAHLPRPRERAKESGVVKSATHIVKFWEQTDYVDLAANEFYCLMAAGKAGLDVPRHELSSDGTAIVIERFDVRADGTCVGFEDFCVLNGLTSRDKYNGSYEARLFKRIPEFVAGEGEERRAAAAHFFRSFVCRAALRDGDGHLKNYGLVYDDVRGKVSPAPVYDVITTTAYVPRDGMALTLDGSTRWPSRKKLLLLGQARCGLSAREAKDALEATADAIAETAPEARRYFADRPAAGREIGERMLAAWADGIRDLGFEAKSVAVRGLPEDETAPPAP